MGSLAACGGDDDGPGGGAGFASPAPADMPAPGAVDMPQGPSSEPGAPAADPGTPAPDQQPGDPGNPSGPDPVDPPGEEPAAPGQPEPTAEPGWAMMGYDLGSTYHNPNETRITRDNAGSLEIAWRADLGGNVYGAPLLVGGTVYGSSENVIEAFDAASGESLWRNDQVGTTGCLAHSDGMLYLHTTDGQVIALDASDGSQAWAMPADQQPTDGSASPIPFDGRLFLGGSDGEFSGTVFRGFVTAMDASNGAAAWTTYTVPEGARGASVWSSVALDPERSMVFATTGNNHGPPATDTSDAFVAFDLATGELRWKNQRTADDTWNLSSPGSPDADFGANPVLYTAMVEGVETAMVAAGQKSGGIHGLRREDGMAVWSRDLCPGNLNGSQGIFVNTSWSGSAVLAACNKGSSSDLYALDGGSGDVIWMTPLSGLVFGRISSVSGVGFVGAGSELVIFDTETGEIIKTIPSVEGSVTGTVTIADGRVAYGEGMNWYSTARGKTLTVLTLP